MATVNRMATGPDNGIVTAATAKENIPIVKTGNDATKTGITVPVNTAIAGVSTSNSNIPNNMTIATAASTANNGMETKPPGKKKKKKSKNKAAPPYKTFQVVQRNASLTPIRKVSKLDVFCIPQNASNKFNATINPKGYDFTLQPGNIKLRKLVQLSEAHYNKKLDEDSCESRQWHKEQEGLQTMAISLVETIRKEWGGFFLRPATPTDLTKWVDIGNDLSIQYVLKMFQGVNNNKFNPDPIASKQQKIQSTFVGQQKQQAKLQPVLPPPPPPQPVAVPPRTEQQLQLGQQPNSPVAPLRLLANQASTTPGRLSEMTPLAPGATVSSLPTMSPGMAFVRKHLNIMTPKEQQSQAQAIVQQTLHGVSNSTKPINKPTEQDPRNVTVTVVNLKPAPATKDSTQVQQPVKRKRGRPRKDEVRPPVPPKRKRGRPPKSKSSMDGSAAEEKVRGRKKRIEVPDPREAPSIVPLPNSPPTMGGTSSNEMTSSSPEKMNVAAIVGGEDHSLPKLNWKSITQPPSIQERRQQPTQGQGVPATPKSPVITGPQPAWAAPVPTENYFTEKEYPVVEKARELVASHDKEWITNYEKLRYTKITLYCNNNVARWSAGQLRHTIKKKNQNKDTTLNPWIAEQQQMYKDFCQWEERARRGRDGDSALAAGEGQSSAAPVVGLPSDFAMAKAGDEVALQNSNIDATLLRDLQRAKILLMDALHFGKFASRLSMMPPLWILFPYSSSDVWYRLIKCNNCFCFSSIFLLETVWHPNQEPPEDACDEWKESFLDLREYVRTRGDTVVSDTVELGVWAKLQRMKYQRSLVALERQEREQASVTGAGGIFSVQTESEDLPLSEGQMKALRCLGFDWDDMESSDWHVMYMKLLEFKHRVGDCLVSPPSISNVAWDDSEDKENDSDDEDEPIFNTNSDPKLYFWVQRQRFEYVRFQKAKEEAAFGNELVEKLLEEEATEGHCDIVDMVRTPNPRRFLGATLDNDVNPNMGVAESQPTVVEDSEQTKGGRGSRTKKSRKNEKAAPSSSDQVSTLTQAQIDALNQVGFIWDLDITGKWINQYRRLHAFYVKHGHSKVTRTTNESKTKLNRWCSQMRRLNQITQNGGKNGLSQTKINLLARLEFIFEFEDLPDRYCFDERYEWLKVYYEVRTQHKDT